MATPKVHKLLQRGVGYVLEGYSRDISRTLQRRAHQTTVDFVVAHLRDAKIFRDRLPLLSYALSIAPKEGDILEFGVCRGTSLRFLAKRAGPSRKLYGFDSFQGLPEEWKGKEFPKGTFSLDKAPKVPSNVTLVPGWFEQTVPEFARSLQHQPALVHIDSDLYSSSKTVLDHVGPRCGAGTVLVFDEFFNYPRWEEGEFRAFNEASASLGWQTKYLAYCSADEQVAVQIEAIRRT